MAKMKVLGHTTVCPPSIILCMCVCVMSVCIFPLLFFVLLFLFYIIFLWPFVWWMCLLGYQILRYSCPRKFEKSHYRCKSLSVLAACIESIFTRNYSDRFTILKQTNLSLQFRFTRIIVGHRGIHFLILAHTLLQLCYSYTCCIINTHFEECLWKLIKSKK